VFSSQSRAMDKMHSEQEFKTVDWRRLSSMLLLLQSLDGVSFYILIVIWARSHAAKAATSFPHDLTSSGRRRECSSTMTTWPHLYSTRVDPLAGLLMLVPRHEIYSFGRLRPTVTSGRTALNQLITHISKEFSFAFFYRKNETLKA
jgi:hypothetical protein